MGEIRKKSPLEKELTNTKTGSISRKKIEGRIHKTKHTIDSEKVERQRTL